MATQRAIDSHIHLWPQETANKEGHAWMNPGIPLAKSHLLSDYCQAARQDQDSEPLHMIVEGVVYIETDVRHDEPNGDLASWAKGPLDEITFLRSIVEGKYGARDSNLLLGVVPWCPMDQPSPVLEDYLRLAEENAGEETWRRVKGFRFLLQSIHTQQMFEALVFSENFISNMGILGKRGFSFDVGVDQRSGGVWQLEALATFVSMIQTRLSDLERPAFIINHLCKPDFSSQDGSDFERWCIAIKSMSLLPKTYMKLSGAFSELPNGLNTTVEIAEYIKPWMRHAFECFKPERIMFGSDWPVCNVKGPLKENSWVAWELVIESLLEDQTYRLSIEDKDRIWHGTAREAYRLL